MNPAEGSAFQGYASAPGLSFLYSHGVYGLCHLLCLAFSAMMDWDPLKPEAKINLCSLIFATYIDDSTTKATNTLLQGK